MEITNSKIRRSVLAVRDAVLRAAEASDLNRQLNALIEALWWLCVANDLLWEDDQGYRDQRPASVHGLVYLRNRATHDPHDVAELAEAGGYLIDTYTDLYGAWRWRSLEDLPEPEKPDRPGAEAFRQHVARKGALDTIREASDFLSAWISGGPADGPEE